MRWKVLPGDGNQLTAVCTKPRWRGKVPDQTRRIGEKKGSKRHLLVDGRGVPLSIVVTGANRHDVSQLAAVLNGRIVSPFMEDEEEHLCADAGYAGDEPRQKMVAAGYTPHVRPRGEEKLEKVRTTGFKARRWVVEACHSWFNRFRKLTIRYEKLDVTHMALIHLAAAIIALRKVKKGNIIYG
jgi:transposase